MYVVHYLNKVQVPVVEARAADGVVLGRLVEAQVHQQLAALQRRAHLSLISLAESTLICVLIYITIIIILLDLVSSIYSYENVMHVYLGNDPK